MMKSLWLKTTHTDEKKCKGDTGKASEAEGKKANEGGMSHMVKIFTEKEMRK